jgi:hypothetical protein
MRWNHATDANCSFEPPAIRPHTVLHDATPGKRHERPGAVPIE